MSSRFFTVLLLAAACGPLATPPHDGPVVVSVKVSDVPLRGAASDWVERFQAGDVAFDTPLREADGLGPVYIRQSCSACHAGAARGPGFVTRFAQVQADGVTPVEGQPLLQHGTAARPFFTAGATRGVLPPTAPDVKVTTRSGTPLFGRGYLEAIDDAAILAQEAAQASGEGGVRGRANRVTLQSEPNPDPLFGAHPKGAVLLGRFGWKARVATLDDFAADALQGDMGLTSPLRPSEVSNLDGLTDDAKPGVDVSAALVNALADYARLLEIPSRALEPRGAALFAQAGCATCHVPALRTRSDYPVPQLAAVDAPVYSDLLLHDLGASLADGIIDGSAGSRDWRTTPLIAVRLQRSFLHDGRAATVEQAITLHGEADSEAHAAVARFQALSTDERAALLRFVEAL
jgi:CxxC motif-containing protein (DUF1111 family)